MTCPTEWPKLIRFISGLHRTSDLCPSNLVGFMTRAEAVSKEWTKHVQPAQRVELRRLMQDQGGGVGLGDPA
jgi:hypothetical protein